MGQARPHPSLWPSSLDFSTLFFSLPHAYKIMGCPAVLVGATGREKVGTRWRTGRAPAFRSQPLFSTQKTLFITETIPDPEDPAESRLSPKPSWLGLYSPQTLTAPSESPSSHRGAPRSLPMQAPYACSLLSQSFLLIFGRLSPLPSSLLNSPTLTPLLLFHEML